MPSNELHRNQFALRAKSTGFHRVIAPRWKSISIQSNIVRHLRDIPRDTHVAKIADYDDTALGTGTLTVHPWRAGPDCGKLLLYYKDAQDRLKISSKNSGLVAYFINCI